LKKLFLKFLCFLFLRNMKYLTYVKHNGFLFLTILAWTSVHGAAEPANSVFKEHHDFESTAGSSNDLIRISDYYKHLSKILGKNKLRIQNMSKSRMVNVLAIHRGLGVHLDRTVQYKVIQEAFSDSMKLCKLENKCQVMDAGCGTGSAMLYFAKFGWHMQGFTVAVNQYNFIKANFPNLEVFLRSYNEIPDDINYSGIFSIETIWYSDWRHTLRVWANHLEYGSRIAIIDDFAVNQSFAESDSDIQGYVEGWGLKSITAVEDLCAFAKLNTRLQCIQRRNLTKEFNVNKYNYRNQEPMENTYKIPGSYYRHKSSMKGILVYELVCLEKV